MKLRALLPTLLAVVAAISTALEPAIAAFWVAHPGAAATVGLVLTAIANFAPQPHK